ARDRRAHLQHRDGRVQPGAGRPARERGEGLSGEPWHQRRPAADGQLRRRASEVRQLARGNAPPEPPRGAHREPEVVRVHGGWGPRPQPPDPQAHMRFIHLYLIGYFLLVVGALLALWQAGVLARVSGTWLVIGMIIAFGLGIMLAVASAKPTITNE